MSAKDDLKTELEALPEQTSAARLRALMPIIDRRVKEGVGYQTIIDLLNARGFNLNRNTFKSCLYRYRKSLKKAGRGAAPQEGAGQESVEIDLEQIDKFASAYRQSKRNKGNP